MRLFLTGARGQLGQSLLENRPDNNHGILCYPHDLTDFSSLKQALSEYRPEVIINAAAYTNVDGAESDKQQAFAVNAEVPKHLARYAAANQSRLIHVSTDYVYSGSQNTPYKVGDPTQPLGVYGASKLAGEMNVLEHLSEGASVLRTAWVYSRFRKNFVLTMLRLMQQQESINVVNDQLGSPTWASSLAHVIWTVIEEKRDLGLAQWTDQGVISWYDFAVAIQQEAAELKLLEKMIPIRPVTSAEFNTIAKRPNYSVLDCSTVTASFNIKQTPWRENLIVMLEQLKNCG